MTHPNDLILMYVKILFSWNKATLWDSDLWGRGWSTFQLIKHRHCRIKVFFSPLQRKKTRLKPTWLMGVGGSRVRISLTWSSVLFLFLPHCLFHIGRLFCSFLKGKLPFKNECVCLWCSQSSYRSRFTLLLWRIFLSMLLNKHDEKSTLKPTLSRGLLEKCILGISEWVSGVLDSEGEAFMLYEQQVPDDVFYLGKVCLLCKGSDVER